MQSKILGAAALAVVLGASSGCGRTDQAEGTPANVPGPAQGGGPAARRIHVEPKVLEDAKVVVAPVVKAPLSAALVLPGEIAADPDQSAAIASPLAGRIQAVETKEGATVKKGDVLVRIAVPEIGKLRAAYASAAARAKAARADANRLKGLEEKRIVPEQEYLDAEAKAKAAESEAAGIASQLSAISFGSTSGPSQIVLTSPIDGVVLSRHAVVGDPVPPDKTLFEIANLSKVWFLARVFEKDLGQVKVGAPADVVLNAYPAQTFAGKIEYVARQVDPVARTVVARIVLENRDDLLRVGLFGNARVGTQGNAGAPTIVVPRGAVTDVNGKPTVFVRKAPGEFEARTVELGAGSVENLEIRAGLKEGEEVVTQGAFTLKSILLRSSLEEEE